MYNKLIKCMFSEIQTVFESGAIVASITLVYVYIDAMTYLNISLTQDEQKKGHFIEWVNKYLKTDPSQSYQYDGNDIYAARCGQLHCYSAFSTFGEKYNCKKFGYHDGSEHIFNPNETKTFVLISVKRLILDFYSAVQSFFLEAKDVPNLKQCIDSRIHKLYQQFLIGENTDDETY